MPESLEVTRAAEKMAEDREDGAEGLAPFLGRWTVSRRIHDRRGGQEGAFHGIAHFGPDGAGLRYHEDGMLTLGQGMPLRATRDYLWRVEQGRIVVDHGDGRPFHAFDPGNPVAEHLCGADTYAVDYDFSRWPQWRTVWVVSGPAKDYRMITDYAPAPVEPALAPSEPARPPMIASLPPAILRGPHPRNPVWQSAPNWSKGRLSRP